MMNKKKRTLIRLTICVLAAVMLLSAIAVGVALLIPKSSSPTASGNFSLFDGVLDTGLEKYLDRTVAYKLPDTVRDTDDLSIIVQVKEEPLLEAYKHTDQSMSFTDYVLTEDAIAIKTRIADEKQTLMNALDRASISYEPGADYASILSGFEIMIKAADFEDVCEVLGDDATPIVGEVYEIDETVQAENQPVNNNVDVQDTGIFNSSDFGYDGSGTVVAVLDTGLDYYHTAFSVENFTADRSQLGMTYDEVAALLGNTRAGGFHAGLTASDVYVNEKIPYAFDYADKDPDVYPLQSNHGTHVAGVIAGKDDTITGVAPNAQLVIMKTFSDIETSARSSWILSALEDCVVLGVDVINMSLGTGCGFSRETDKEMISGVYDRIREAGISLVVAASNSYSSAYGSDKNGNLGLTTNPDTATVGSPGTYEGALSVASINGAKTSYILYNGTIIYFDESTDRVYEERDFFEELMPDDVNELEMEYVLIPGVGRSADYTGIDVTGKIALIERGDTTFEEKANVAQEKGAAAVIIFNNVSGKIKMNVGETTIPVCSIEQDAGEMLAAQKTGKLSFARSQKSGPFMSDFSSWGPTPDLGIKPEITAHGGLILSAVPGQDYDRISGTSMACPNVAGLTALLREYVKKNFPDIAGDSVEIAATVNRLLMSTADIIMNTNGLPYSVRKQGAGLANLTNSGATQAYIMTYRENGSVMDKSKLELGDDPNKTGVYTLQFSVKNFGASSLTYDVSAYVMTEGVSDTKTDDGKTTVTEEGYLLDGATVKVSSIKNGANSGNSITVAAGQTADVTVTITLSDSDKKYLDESFANGMYVEGFVVLDSADEKVVDLSAPYLAFYGDWTVAPLFDLTFYDTNADELDNAIDLEDKTRPDAYATRPIGGISEDYISYLGSYYFQQDPSDKVIAANENYICLSNQDGTVHSLRFVWAGLLRNARKIVITITDDATGEVIFERVEEDVRKSYGDGGSIYPANIDIEFDTAEYNLKNNATYTVKLVGYVDYGDGGSETNLNNVFEFPLTIDYQAPAITDVEFYTEYDRTEKKTRLFAKLAVYDNHYAMSLNFGYVAKDSEGYVMQGFDKYMTPVYSSENSTTYVIYELTDYIYQIKRNAVNPNTFTVVCYDYAINESTYEIELPDEYLDFYFNESYRELPQELAGRYTTEDAEVKYGITLSPNELYTLTPVAYPSDEWPELLEYISTNVEVARVVNNKVVAVSPGITQIIARDNVTKKRASFYLIVLGEEDTGYVKYDKPVTDNFVFTGFYVDKAYYYLDSSERDLGLTGEEAKFASRNNYSLSMFPSEAVTLRWILDEYFPEETDIVFESSNSDIVTVDQNGKITAVAEGYASVSARVVMDGKTTYYSQSISINVKDPYITTGPSLTHYFGLGGLVHIPEELALTEIGQYAFANFDYIPKTEDDEISEESPDATKIWYIGDDTIEEVVIPEGVKTIGAYAFAGLESLKKVTLPDSLESIQQGAFYGCTSLTTVEGIENVKFVNQRAFENCNLSGTLTFGRAVAIADYSFAGNANLSAVTLSESTRSVGAYAFAGNSKMKTVTIEADLIKLGQQAFRDCASLESISVNAAVIPTSTFDGCTSLTSVILGKDVNVIGEYAFRDTKVTSFTVDAGNTTFYPVSSKSYLLNQAKDQLLLVAPGISGEFTIPEATITSIANAAFSGNGNLTSVSLPNVTSVGNYAFADCTGLKTIKLGTLTSIGDYAFYNTAITETPSFISIDTIGKYAFADTALKSVAIPDSMTVGEGAFADCGKLESVSIGNNVVLEARAFYSEINNNWTYDKYKVDTTNIYYYIYQSPLHSLTIGRNAVIGEGAFEGAAELEKVSLGTGAIIGNNAFYNAASLTDIDLSGVISIGENAFSGDVLNDYSSASFTTPAIGEDGLYIYRYFAPKFTSIDLSSLTSLGTGAFSYCTELTEVKLGDSIETIPDQAFMSAQKLAKINLGNIKRIGSNVFNEAVLTEVDLSSAESIGKYAFVYNEVLTTATFKNGAIIEEGAFSYATALENLVNIGNVVSIGDYAFAYTSVTEADLRAATYIGTHAFLKETATDFKVTIGTILTDIGDNPFALCRLTPFTGISTETFNGNSFESSTNTYDLNENIRIIDGSLYRVVPYGLELITFAGTTDDITVADNTVRISAMAFAGSEIQEVILPSTLISIGHKAFYDCQDLVMVSFSSYFAPQLEEEYDYAYYMSGDNLPATGDYEYMEADGVTIIEKPGLAIVPYFMWNVTSQPWSIYYGANFVDYIGHIDNPIVMVRPSNGIEYDSFIYTRYFNTVVDAAPAADEITLAAIAAIDLIPSDVTLAHEDIVIAARAAYDLIATIEQQYLVTNIDKLTSAEKRIANLKALDAPESAETQPDTTDPDTPPLTSETSVGTDSALTTGTDTGAATDNTVTIVLTVCLIVTTVAAAVFAALCFAQKKPASEKTTSQAAVDTQTDNDQEKPDDESGRA